MCIMKNKDLRVYILNGNKFTNIEYMGFYVIALENEICFSSVCIIIYIYVILWHLSCLNGLVDLNLGDICYKHHPSQVRSPENVFFILW